MYMGIEEVSNECIKPSSPTPCHLKTHKLSLLDQCLPSVYVPMILFYPLDKPKTNVSMTDEVVSKRSQLLKKSLSETLTRFYPFAGKIKDNLSVDCNDEGVYYVEARTNSSLEEFLQQIDQQSISKFFPGEASFTWIETCTPGSHVAMIQITNFACGGVAIAALVSHVTADGTALTTFLKSWAAMARNSPEEAGSPDFSVASLFPQNGIYPKEAKMMTLGSRLFKEGKCVTRRIVFDASAIASLRAKARSQNVTDPTRVEVVSALLSRCIMATTKAKFGANKLTSIAHAVNLRRRAVPPYSEYLMGNLFWLAPQVLTGEGTELDSLVCQLRKAIRNINGDFVKIIQGEDGLRKISEFAKGLLVGPLLSAIDSGSAEFLLFTSWCNFGLYEIDFGWGKPIWTSCAGFTKSETVFVDTIFLLDTKFRDGIEALMTLGEEEMAILEKNEELLAFGSFERSPLELNWPPPSQINKHGDVNQKKKLGE